MSNVRNEAAPTGAPGTGAGGIGPRSRSQSAYADRPSRRVTGSPWRDAGNNLKERKPPAEAYRRSQHTLCIRETGNPDHADYIPHITYCWCMCKQCWDSQTNRCICSRCPCPRGAFILSPMPAAMTTRPAARVRTRNP